MPLELVKAKVHDDDECSSMRVYMWPAAKNPVLEHLINRRDRPYEALKPLVKDAIKMAGLNPATVTDIQWSQYAGCTCPCSPGFIVTATSKNLHFKAVHATFKDTAEQPGRRVRSRGKRK